MPDDIDTVFSPLPATAAAEPAPAAAPAAAEPAPTPAAAAPPPDLKTAEQFAAAKNVPAWLFAAMRAGERWPFGQQMTEATFDAAVQKTNTIAIGH